MFADFKTFFETNCAILEINIDNYLICKGFVLSSEPFLSLHFLTQTYALLPTNKIAFFSWRWILLVRRQVIAHTRIIFCREVGDKLYRLVFGHLFVQLYSFF